MNPWVPTAAGFVPSGSAQLYIFSPALTRRTCRARAKLLAAKSITNKLLNQKAMDKLLLLSEFNWTIYIIGFMKTKLPIFLELSR